MSSGVILELSEEQVSVGFDEITRQLELGEEPLFKRLWQQLSSSILLKQHHPKEVSINLPQKTDGTIHKVRTISHFISVLREELSVWKLAAKREQVGEDAADDLETGFGHKLDPEEATKSLCAWERIASVSHLRELFTVIGSGMVLEREAGRGCYLVLTRKLHKLLKGVTEGWVQGGGEGIIGKSLQLAPSDCAELGLIVTSPRSASSLDAMRL
ncbi:hypothetical protein BT69DRAFT_1293257 [Atractiella rhizophila]|nr:hypothetical protein BT69DRAFT_1293257 [Atractiella rhizophila]